MATQDTILLVDDEREFASLLGEFLERQGHEVIAAHTGEEGLKILRRAPISLALLDLQLPDMDGVVLMREAQRLGSPPDVVIITGHATLDSAVAAVEAGAAGYVLKPVDFTRLSVLIRKLLEQRHLAQDNARLQAEQRRRAQELEILLTIAQTLTSTLELPAVLDAVAQSAITLIGAQQAAVFELDPRDQRLYARVTKGMRRELPLMAPKLGQGATGGAALSRQPFFSSDVRHDPLPMFDEVAEDSGTTLRDLFRRHGFRAVLAVPLVSKETVFGACTIFWDDVHPYDEREVRLLTALAQQAAVGIENARLYEQARRERRQLEVLYDVSRQLAEVHDTDQILSLIVNETPRLLNADAAALRLLEGDDLVLKARTESAAALVARSRIKVGESLSGRVVATGKPVVVEDLVEDTRYDPSHKKAALALGFAGFLGVPLRAHGGAIGALNVYTKGRRRFTAEETLLLTAFADHASLAIEKARLYQRAEERTQKLTALSTLTRVITSAQDSQQVFRAVAKAATTLLGARMSRVWVDDPESQGLRTQGSFGMDPKFEELMTEFALIPYGRGLTGRIFESQTAEYIADVQQDPRWLNQRLAKEAGLRAYAGIPLITGERVVGVLTTLFGERREFSPEEKELMNLLADHAAITIDKLRLFEETQTQRTRLAQIFDSTSDGIMLVNRHGRIEAANRRAGELLGFDPAAVAGLGLAHILVGHFHAVSDYDRAVAPLRSLLQDTDRVGQGDLEIPALRRILHWAGQPTINAAGATVGLTLTFQDVTQEREVSQMKSDFVSFVTHQLRTPLAGIKWLLELAVQGADVAEETRSYIQDARDAAERLVGLVNDLLDISRLESGKLTITPQEIRLGELTQSVVNEVGLLVREKGHQLSVTGADDIPPVVADPQLLRQVVMNLVSNAIKYTLPGGEIAIRMSPDATLVRWAIQDSGIGIPKEAQGRLFEKFYRAENVLTIETEGTGLGLYLVRLIMERLGGRIWCESEEGKGATFLFTLPRQR